MTVAPTISGLEAPPTAAVARTIHATKTYGSGDTTVRALDDVSVELPAGRFTAIMGPSGSGKSTLMHCLAGLDTLTAGQVFIGDDDLGRLSDRQLTQLRRDRIGFVFQSFNLVPTLTALENITLPMALAGRKPDQAWLDGVIDTVGLRDRLSHRPSELSGGQQQRVAVARALAGRPQVVFADEPTGNLDSRSGAEILAFMALGGRASSGRASSWSPTTPSPRPTPTRALFLADGRIVDHMHAPTAERVLDRMKAFGD